MKKYLVILFSLFLVSTVKAGDGDSYFSLSGGWLHYNAISSELTFERTLKYHNAWEIGLDYYNQIFSYKLDSLGNEMNYHSLMFEGVYKHNVVRFKNANLRFRAAAGIGVNEKEKFTMSISPGFEFTYTTSYQWQFFIQEKTQFSFWTRNHSWFRIGIMFGIKIPLRFN
jgi:hypothetical protein